MLLCTLCAASVRQTAVPHNREALTSREQQIFRPALPRARFQDVPHTAARSRCEDTEPPQALATPGPLLLGLEEPAVTVSFIVGTDGKVHSPLILRGDDPRGNRLVLDAVRHWRYRPAMCNGVPTEVEGKVQFSRR
jgi:TonB family protein